MPEEYRNYNFDDLEGDVLIQIVKRVNEWDFKNPYVLAILSKFVGIGKTHLSICILKKYLQEYLKRNIDFNYKNYLKNECNELSASNWMDSFKIPSIKFCSELEVYREVEATYSEKFLVESNIVYKYAEYDFLVIDDLFAFRCSNFPRRIILAILEIRRVWKNKPTVFVSNKTLDELFNIDPALCSRLNNSLLVDIQTHLLDMRVLNCNSNSVKNKIKNVR